MTTPSLETYLLHNKLAIPLVCLVVARHKQYHKHVLGEYGTILKWQMSYSRERAPREHYHSY
jgi:hypothetical protein